MNLRRIATVTLVLALAGVPTARVRAGSASGSGTERARPAGEKASGAPAEPPKAGHPIFQLEAEVESVRAEVRLNGFPLGVVTGLEKSPGTLTSPVNPYLVGSGNVVEVVLDAGRDPHGKPLPLAGARFELTVRRFEKGGIVEPGAGQVVTRYAAPPAAMAELAAGKRKPPLTVTHSFANDVVDFSAELRGAAPFANEAAVRDYGMKLRALVAKRDVAGLLAEWEPKLRAWSAAYAEPYEAFAGSMKEELSQLAAGADVAFSRDDLEPRPVCGGRIWEIGRRGGLPLLRSANEADGATVELPVYVAPRAGGLKVVR